jgi:pyrroloquinoline quinone (PQQ) biosynthesis protein C
LGAIHSFEVQQPEVAQTKMEGLIKYYGFDNSELRYFREHLSEHEHVDYGISLLNEKAEKKEFEIGFRLGSEKFYHALDLFV